MVEGCAVTGSNQSRHRRCSVLCVNNGLCAVEKLNVVRGEHGIREGSNDAMSRCSRVYSIEGRDLVGRKLRRVSRKQANPRRVQPLVALLRHHDVIR
jgi:hypothetical protein